MSEGEGRGSRAVERYYREDSKGVAMRSKAISIVAAVVSLALVVTGCGRSAPEITDEQVEAWRALVDEMIPAATMIEVETAQATTMAGNSNQVFITVSFANFADLKGSYEVVAEVEAAVKEQAPRAEVSVSIINQGAAAFEKEVASRLLENVPGLEHVYARSQALSYPATEPLTLRLTPYLYLTDTEVIDPLWLDNVADHAQEVALDAGGRITSLIVLPSAAWELSRDPLELEDVMIPVQDLSAFEGSDADSGCVRTDSWAYDVTNDWVIVHPASEPDGACA